MTTKEQILNLFADCEFDGIFTSMDLNKIFDHLPDDFSFDWAEGASKLVIIPNDKDYVIKIPYTGRYNGYVEDEYDDFSYANNSNQYNWDYCYTESLIYHLAKMEKINKAFAKETLVGFINGQPLYMQEKANILDCVGESSTEEECRKTEEYLDGHNFRVFNLGWQADALKYYGKKQFNKIMDFIEWNEIGDLHDGNLGYIGARPVIVDYSDFVEL